MVEKIENLVQNPRGKYTSGTVEVRRNLASLSGVTGGTGLAVVNDTVDDPRFSSLVRRMTITTPPTEGGSWLVWYGTLPTVTVGDVFVYQIRVSSDLPVTGVTLGGSNAPSRTGTKLSDVDHGDGTRTLVYKLTITGTNTNMTPAILLELNLANVSPGKVFLAGECCVEKTSEVGDFFDGSYSPDPDLTPSWTGTANESASVLTGLIPTGFSQDVDGHRYVSHDSEGNGVITTFKKGPGPDGVYSLIGAVTEGQWVGISGWIYSPDDATSVSMSFGLVQRDGSPWGLIAPVLITDADMLAATSGFTYVSGAVQVTSSATSTRVLLGPFKEPIGARFMVRDIMVSVADTEAEALKKVQTFFDGDSEPFYSDVYKQRIFPKWSGNPGSSVSYFEYEPPFIPSMVWNTTEQRTFYSGVDRGVLGSYPESGVVVPWSGLVSVTTKQLEAEPVSYYIDGQKFYVDAPVGDFELTLNAYTFPLEFSRYDGYGLDSSGAYISNQSKTTFALSYRTMLGTDYSQSGGDYQLHFVYNCIATPTEHEYNTLGDIASPSLMSWKITTLPTKYNGKSTSHIILDTRKIPMSKIRKVEDKLYNQSSLVYFPSPDTIFSLLA